MPGGGPVRLWLVLRKRHRVRHIYLDRGEAPCQELRLHLERLRMLEERRMEALMDVSVSAVKANGD
jgi:hypothetical protein